MTEKLRSVLTARGVEYVFCSFVELTGAPKAKLVPVSHIEEFAQDGAGFAGFACGDVGQGPHDPDICSVPDFRSLTILPWRKNVAWVTGNLYVEGKPWPLCPRTVLMHQLELAKKQGYVVNIGIEPEFILLKKDAQGEYVPWDEFDTLVKPCYDLRALYRNLDLMTALLGFMQELGWDPYANDHEDANCQFEINWTYSDALTTADRHTFFKMLTSQVAKRFGAVATHMPKPFSKLTGSGCHFHLSLWDGEGRRNLFLDEGDARGLGLSTLGYQFLAGAMEHARALSALVAPTVNDYKRLSVGEFLTGVASGLTWTPAFISYGDNNRTQMFRVPEPGRFECRLVSGAVNPYLGLAGFIAAGLDGIRRKLDPGPPNIGRNMYALSPEDVRSGGPALVPQSLPEALDAFEGNSVITGALGPELTAEFLRVKRGEWTRYHSTVSQWEIDHYLALF